MAQRYHAAPVKTGLQAIRIPDTERCKDCGAPMTSVQQVPNAKDVRVKVQWNCSGCHRLIWKEYALRYLGEWRD
jgi:uncharacterized protein with PIN domain